MKCSLALASSLLLVTSTLAAPRLERGLAGRLQRRGHTLQGSIIRSKESKNSKTKFNAATGNTSDVEYSENWSGAAITSPPSGQTFNAASGQITIPTPSTPSGVASTYGEYATSAWVGIDGNTYSTAILQTGLDFTVSISGVVSYDAWYEWYPDYAMDFDLTISAGDIISMYVNATTTTSGSATIENLTTGKTVTKSLTSASALGGENAEWIVEDFEEGNSLIAFADFGNVTFTNCVAATVESSEGVSRAMIMNIENTSDELLTDTNFISDSSFQVSYTSSSTSTTTSGTTGGGTRSGNGGANGGVNRGGKGGGHDGGKGNGAVAGGFGFFRRWMMLSEI